MIEDKKDIFDIVLDDWKVDSKIDIFALDKEVLKIPKLHAKYLEFYNIMKRKQIKIMTKIKEQQRKNYMYYSGKATAKDYEDRPFELKVLKSDMPVFMDSDPVILKLEEALEMYTTNLDNIRQILKQLSDRTFQIKNAIEYQKFSSGA